MPWLCVADHHTPFMAVLVPQRLEGPRPPPQRYFRTSERVVSQTTLAIKGLVYGGV